MLEVHRDMNFLKQEIQNLIQLDHPHALGLVEHGITEELSF